MHLRAHTGARGKTERIVIGGAQDDECVFNGFGGAFARTATTYISAKHASRSRAREGERSQTRAGKGGWKSELEHSTSRKSTRPRWPLNGITDGKSTMKKKYGSKEERSSLAPGRDYSLGTRSENNRDRANASAITGMQRPRARGDMYIHVSYRARVILSI